MNTFVYISDIFCPWCYGFAPTLRRILDAYPFPIEVFCGCLVDTPRLSSVMGDPRGRAFFDRLGQTTGREIGQGFRAALQEGQGVPMDSFKSARLLAALKELIPGKELLQMETFQEAFYGQGLDVLDPDVQAKIVEPWDILSEVLAAMQKEKTVRERAEAEMAKAEELLGDFVVYPTLFLQDETGTLHPVARGYAPEEEVTRKIEAVLHPSEDAAQAGDAGTVHACTLDGRCC